MAVSNVTIARPYAEAAFRLARDKHAVAAWSEMLALAASVAADPRIASLTGNPQVSREQLGKIVLGVCGDKVSADGRNFLLLLVENGRLGVLPEIRELFEDLRREHEGVLEVEVTSAYPMDDSQLAQLRQKLQAKYGRQVQASVSVDPELIGGVRVKIGDEVLDASVRGKLQGMASALAR